MRARIAESFTRSLARLEGPERAAVTRAAFDFLLGPRRPGLRLHRLVHREDARFWSLRVGRDLRVIVHRDGDEVVLCHAGHHDRAYDWAAHRVGAPGSSGGCEESWSLELAPGPGPAAPEARPPIPPPAPPPAIPAGAPPGRPAAFPSEPRPIRAATPDPPSPRRLRVSRRAAGPLPAASTASTGGPAPAPLLQLLRIFRQVEALPPRAPVRGVPAAADPAGGAEVPGAGDEGVGRPARRLREVLLLALAAVLPFLGAALAVRARRAAREAGRAREAALLAGRRSVEELATALETLREGERPALPPARPAGGEGRAWEALRDLDRFLAMDPRGIRSLADATGKGAEAAPAPLRA